MCAFTDNILLSKSYYSDLKKKKQQHLDFPYNFFLVCYILQVNL